MKTEESRTIGFCESAHALCVFHDWVSWSLIWWMSECECSRLTWVDIICECGGGGGWGCWGDGCDEGCVGGDGRIVELFCNKQRKQQTCSNTAIQATTKLEGFRSSLSYQIFFYLFKHFLRLNIFYFSIHHFFIFFSIISVIFIKKLKSRIHEFEFFSIWGIPNFSSQSCHCGAGVNFF